MMFLASNKRKNKKANSQGMQHQLVTHTSLASLTSIGMSLIRWHQTGQLEQPEQSEGTDEDHKSTTCLNKTLTRLADLVGSGQADMDWYGLIWFVTFCWCNLGYRALVNLVSCLLTTIIQVCRSHKLNCEAQIHAACLCIMHASNLIACLCVHTEIGAKQLLEMIKSCEALESSPYVGCSEIPETRQICNFSA